MAFLLFVIYNVNKTLQITKLKKWEFYLRQKIFLKFIT